MPQNNGSNGGIGLGGALFLIFLTLKLLAIDPVASWSWWWVTSPLWIGASLVLGIIAIVALGGGLSVWITQRRNLRRIMRGDQ